MVRKTKEMNMESLMKRNETAKWGRAAFDSRCSPEASTPVRGHVRQLSACLPCGCTPRDCTPRDCSLRDRTSIPNLAASTGTFSLFILGCENLCPVLKSASRCTRHISDQEKAKDKGNMTANDKRPRASPLRRCFQSIWQNRGWAGRSTIWPRLCL